MKKTTLLKDLNESDLINLCDSLNFPKFHGSQIYKWMFQKKCESINEMTDIPLDLQNIINDNFENS